MKKNENKNKIQKKIIFFLTLHNQTIIITFMVSLRQNKSQNWESKPMHAT